MEQSDSWLRISPSGLPTEVYQAEGDERASTRQHGREERGAGSKMLDENRFVLGVRTFADCAHSVEGGIPRAAVKLPSEPPPVEASLSVKPSS